jgi:hypothetical protein
MFTRTKSILCVSILTTVISLGLYAQPNYNASVKPARQMAGVSVSNNNFVVGAGVNDRQAGFGVGYVGDNGAVGAGVTNIDREGNDTDLAVGGRYEGDMGVNLGLGLSTNGIALGSGYTGDNLSFGIGGTSNEVLGLGGTFTGQEGTIGIAGTNQGLNIIGATNVNGESTMVVYNQNTNQTYVMYADGDLGLVVFDPYTGTPAYVLPIGYVQNDIHNYY